MPLSYLFISWGCGGAREEYKSIDRPAALHPHEVNLGQSMGPNVDLTVTVLEL